MSRPKKIEDGTRASVVLSKDYLKHLRMVSLETSVVEGDIVTVSELVRRAIDRWTGIEKQTPDIEKIQTIENDIPNFGYVYVAEDEENICKIGVSRNFPDKRIKNLTTKYHKDFKFVGYIQCTYPYELEKALHHDLGAYRIKGEWFLLSYLQIKEKTELNFIDACFDE